jgi:hypothetical protein
MVEHPSGVPQRMTAGSLWQAISGRPLSADLLDWPPDLFALTSLLLERSGAFRFAMSPPPGRQWPPGSRSGWSATVEAAGRAWSGVVDAPAEPAPPLLVSMMEVMVAAAATPLEELSTGADWDLCAAPNHRRAPSTANVCPRYLGEYVCSLRWPRHHCRPISGGDSCSGPVPFPWQA